MQDELRNAAGQMLLVGFQGTHKPEPPICDALREGRVGGVILFRRNVLPGEEGLDVLAGLNAALDACRPDDGTPIFIGVDQEGGRVMRVRDGVSPIPAMGVAGACKDAQRIADLGEVIASELAALGFNLNFAPVLDVFTNPQNTVIGDRAFGTEPERVAELAGALTVGHYMNGVVPCGKHFPGHGDTLLDSHHDLPVVMHGPQRLEAVELLPFARAVQSGIPMIMTAHILMPALDALHPITLSPVGLRQLLRNEMGFDGVVITDDLEMKAISERYTIEETVELGLAAGVDIFLICHTREKWERAFNHIVHLAETDPVQRERVLASARRVRNVKANYLSRVVYEVPTDLHEHLATPHNLRVIEEIHEEARLS